VLCLVAATDDEVRDELGREEAVLDDPRRLRQPCRERGRIADRTRVVGDDAAVGAAGGIAQLDGRIWARPAWALSGPA